MPIVIRHGILSLPSAVVAKVAKDNYVDDISGDQSYDFIVPTGKIWHVYGGFTERRGPSPVFQIMVYNPSSQEILQSPQSDADSKDICWGVFPTQDMMKGFQIPFPLSAGSKVTYTYHTNPYDSSVSLVVLEEDA